MDAPTTTTATTSMTEMAQYAQIIDSLLRDPLFLDIDEMVADEVDGALQSIIQEEQQHSDSQAGDATDASSTMHHISEHSDCTDNDSDGAKSARNTRNSASRAERKRVADAVAAAIAAAATKTCGCPYKPRKVRKTTYHARKEEKVELLSQAAELQERLTTLEGQRSAEAKALAESQFSNALLRESARNQQLSLATAQCVVSGSLNGGEHTNPLSTTCIRLGKDFEDRRKTLLSMKERVIRHACEYIGARSRFLDPLKRHVSEEQFETARGNYCFARYDVRQFPNVASVKQVYDAFVTYLLNIEISVSERLGNITTRDDFDTVENSVANFRFLTTEFGVPVEKQGVVFMQFFESHELSNGGPCGVVVVDRVEEDELYPYMSNDSMRKDVSGVVVFTPHWKPRADGKGGESQELVVTMSTGKYIKLHRSESPLATSEVVEKMRENIIGWGDITIATMNDTLYCNNTQQK